MLTRATLTIIVAAGALGVAGASASADVVTFEFSEVDGNYNSGSGTFTAVAQNIGLQTQGDVTSIGDGTATFDPGMTGLEDLFISIQSDGTGIWAITDSTSEDLQGDLSGTWADIGDFLVFSGTLTGAFDNPGGTFDGSNGQDGFTQLAGDLTGAITILVAAEDFNDFSDAVTGVQGILVPAPGALALLGVAGLVSRRRRA